MYRKRITVITALITICFCLAATVCPLHARQKETGGKMEKRKFFPEPQKVFWQGIVTLKVTSFDRAREGVRNTARAHNGNSCSEEIHTSKNGRKYGQILIRIPVEKKYKFMDDVHGLGVLYSQKISAPDVTEEFVDLGRRLKNLQAEENQLLHVLTNARHVLEVLQVQSHLFNVRVEIERITTRRSEIALKSETALFTVVLFEPEALREPTTPGGIKEFFPRWWCYYALPLAKSTIKTTWYRFSEYMVSLIFGIKGNTPGILLISGFAVSFLVFLFTIWPALRRNLNGTLGDLKGKRLSFSGIFFTFFFLYFFHLLFPPAFTTVMVFFLLWLWWLGFSKTGQVRAFLENMREKGIKPEYIHLLLLFPPAAAIIKAIFPELWLSVKEIASVLIMVLIIVTIFSVIVIAAKEGLGAVKKRILNPEGRVYREKAEGEAL
jgi:hypothetical protein